MKEGIRHFEAYKLDFEISDIKFILLKKDSDVPGMIKYINQVFRQKKGNEKILKTLVSKIFTLEQLRQDFNSFGI